jgi:aminopeptidase N
VFNTLPEKLVEILSPNSYEKGSWVLHMLRNEIGDQAFWKGIRLYYKEYRNANASTKDFQQIMESVSDQKLDNFTKQWLYTPGHPVLNASWVYHEKSETLDIIIEQLQNPIFNFPLEIAVYTPNELFPKIETLKIDQKTNKFSIKGSLKPSHLALDPKVNLLFEGKMKN